MKKTLLVAALVAGFAGAASASTVTLSGEVKAGFKAAAELSYTGSTLQKTVKDENGQDTVKDVKAKGFSAKVDHFASASFKLAGSEDLDNGLKAIFEIGVDASLTPEKSITEVQHPTKGLELSSAFLGLQGDWGTVTVGLQEDTIYTDGFALKHIKADDTKHKIYPENPFIKYVGEFSGVKVAANLGDINMEGLGFGVLESQGTDTTNNTKYIKRTPVVSLGFGSASVSAEYAKDALKVGATFAIDGVNAAVVNAAAVQVALAQLPANATEQQKATAKQAALENANGTFVGLETEASYKFIDLVTVYGGYGMHYDVLQGMYAIAKDGYTYLGHHKLYAGVKAEHTYKIDEKSNVTVKAGLKASYNSGEIRMTKTDDVWSSDASGVVSFELPLSVAYTYDFSKRTSFTAELAYEPSIDLDFAAFKGYKDKDEAGKKAAREAFVAGWDTSDNLFALPTVSATLSHKF